MNRVLEHMHTKISVDIPKCPNESIFGELDDLFEDLENRFSSYKSDSEVSKYATGSVALNTTSPDLRQIITLCKHYETITDGYFSPYFNTKFDPTGLVKGWAIKQAANLIKIYGYDDFIINAGGDIYCSSSGSSEWNIGIANPVDPKSIIAKIKLTNMSVATSGNYERGRHIVNPKTKKPVSSLKSVTVLSPDIIEADVYATAIFAMGSDAISFAKNNKNIKTIIVKNDGQVIET